LFNFLCLAQNNALDTQLYRTHATSGQKPYGHELLQSMLYKNAYHNIRTPKYHLGNHHEHPFALKSAIITNVNIFTHVVYFVTSNFDYYMQNHKSVQIFSVKTTK